MSAASFRATTAAIAPTATWTTPALALALALAGCQSGDEDRALASGAAARTEIFAGPVPAGSAANAVAILDASLGLALVNNFGQSAENKLVPFDPRTGQTTASLALPTLGFAPGLLDSNGDPAPATFAANFPSLAALAGGKVFVTAGNLDFATFASQPGALLVYDRQQGRPVAPARALVLTNAQGAALYNPSQVIPFEDAQGDERLAVVVCGAFQFPPALPEAAIVIVDPATEAVTARIALGARNINSAAAALSSDRRLYLGSASESEIFEVDLDQPSVSAPVAITTSIASAPGAFNNVTAIGLSADERTLFVASSNNASVSIVDRTLLQETAVLTGFARTQTDREAQSFSNLVQSLLVRPGRPGVDYQGPEVLVATINLDAAIDQARPDVRSAIDAIERGAQGQLALTLNDMPGADFTAGPKGDLQQLLSHPAFPDTMFALEGGTGVLHALSLGR